MVRNYIRKTDRQSWNETAMVNAIMACHSNVTGYRKAAVIFNVTQTTLERRVKLYKETEDKASASKKGLYHCTYLPLIL